MTEPHQPVAVVTGASSGIGLELAKAFAKHGFDLVVAADGDDIHRVAAELDAQAVQADLSTPEGVKALVPGSTGIMVVAVCASGQPWLCPRAAPAGASTAPQMVTSSTHFLHPSRQR
jgi:NAD(P)-dependent dehydrogenase (short-subunit alcohol dehydrogenase family)